MSYNVMVQAELFYATIYMISDNYPCIAICYQIQVIASPVYVSRYLTLRAQVFSKYFLWIYMIRKEGKESGNSVNRYVLNY